MPIPIWPTVMPCMAVPVVEFPTWELVLIFRNSKFFLCQYFLFLCHIYVLNKTTYQLVLINLCMIRQSIYIVYII